MKRNNHKEKTEQSSTIVCAAQKQKKCFISTQASQVALVGLLVLALIMPLGNISGSTQLALAQASTEAAGNAADPAAFGTSASGASFAASVTSSKDEVVYGMLDGSGTFTHGYVVNHFVVESSGELIDFGNYDSVSNLSTTKALTAASDKVSAQVTEGDFYYQGNLSKMELPWIISIEYKLNGAKIAPDQLAGKSGKLEIIVNTTQNTKADPVFFDNYLLQIQMILDAGTTRSLVANGATVASAGKDTQIAFMVMPGKDGNVALSAQVTNFEMPSIQISGLPFSMIFDVPNTDKILDDMSSLSDAIGALSEGTSELNKGMVQLQNGSSGLKHGSSEIKNALGQLDASAAQLSNASTKINAALEEIANQMSAGSINPAQITQLVSALDQLAISLESSDAASPGLAEGLLQIKGGLESSVTAMDGYMASLGIVDSPAITALLSDGGYAGLSVQSRETIQSLISTNTKAADVVGTWYGSGGNRGVRAALTSAATGLDSSAEGASKISTQIGLLADGLESYSGNIENLVKLAKYMDQLSQEYSTFDTGMNDYSKGMTLLSKNYESLDSGLKLYINGADSIQSGISSLHDGAVELYVNVEDLPQVMQDEIDSYLASYQASDFELKSFMSDKNIAIDRVQFIMVSDAIEIPKAKEAPVVEEDAGQSFWDRLAALF